jgi:hypothetical protein
MLCPSHEIWSPKGIVKVHYLRRLETALLGAIPLALSFGNGSKIRRPLGIAIIGGLLISQLLTLYTTPVVYLYLDRLGQWSLRTRGRLLPRLFRSGDDRLQ